MQQTDTTLDHLLGGRVKMEQPATGYRAAIDPVLLAAAIPAVAGERALELGLGAGAASLCLLARVDDMQITGIEKDIKFAELARRNAALNGVAGQLEIIPGDICDKIPHPPFDHVFCNPPFHDTQLHGDRGAASHMPAGNIMFWVEAAFRHLKDKGCFTLIHRADGLSGVLKGLGEQPAGAIKILPIAPHAGTAAKRIIVSAIKGRKTPLELLEPLVVHKDGGGYTDLCEAILRDAAPLPLKG